MRTMSMNTLGHFRAKIFLSTAVLPALLTLTLALPMAMPSQAHANDSVLSLSAELPADELSHWLNAAFPEEFSGEGERAVCERIIGIKVCGDARWQYQVQRTGQVTFPEADNTTAGLRIGVPLSVHGNVGVEGDVSRLLGLNAVPISAALMLFLDAGVTGTDQGCPVLTVNVLPQWQQKPSAVLPGNIKISFTEVLEKALAKEVQDVQQKINDSYDCDALLAQIQPLWPECYLDASEPRTGAGVWKIALQAIHWSVQTARSNNTYALVAGIDADLNLDMGLTPEDVESRLRMSNCENNWNQIQVVPAPATDTPATDTPATDRETQSVRAAGTKVVFDPQMASNSQQPVRLNITHQSMAAYAQSEFSNRNLGTDDGGNELFIKTVQLQPVNLKDANAVVLQTQFNATVRAGEGVGGWFQKLLGFEEKTLDGVMRVQARPVWDPLSRVLSFEALEADVTELEPGSKLSLTHAAFVLLERHAQKSLSKQSKINLGDAIDGLSQKANDKIDSSMQERLSPYGGQWQANTAKIQVNNLVALDNGMQLDAQLNADWVIRFNSNQWPTDFQGLKRIAK